MYINDNGEFIEAIAFWDFKKENFNLEGIDIIYHIHSYVPIDENSYEFYTIEHELKAITEEKLFLGYKSRFRTQIRKAKTLDFEFKRISNPTEKEVEEFVGIFNSFAEWKDLGKISLKFLNSIAKAGKLQLTYMIKDGEKLVAHSHYVSEGRARLYHSASTNNSFDVRTNGFANKLLTHYDILDFANECKTYDMGGLSDVKRGEEHVQGIINFKRSFGGKEVTHYKSVSAIGPRGEEIYKKYWK